MKSLQDNLKRILSSDWLIVAAILGIFLLTNRYIFGWDDQHLEVPLLKHLIDPSLYRGDYYVESLKENFTTFLYPLLSKFITVDQVQPAYLVLYVTVRFFFFLAAFKLWKFISGGNRAVAFFCVLAIFMIGRPEEFIKRTFSHQAFAYPFVFAGIYYFYRERYLVASLILGFAANFHALFALFPMLYLLAYLLFFKKEKKAELFFKSWLAFTVAALPFVIWTIERAIRTRLHAAPQIYGNWMELYLLSCPQNFIFGTTPLKEALGNFKLLLSGLQDYILAAVLYAFHWTVNDDFRWDLKVHALAIVVLGMTAATFFFTYIIPSHFILDLNLVRNEQFIRFFLTGYTVVFLWKNLSGPLWKVLLLSMLVVVCGGKDAVEMTAILVLGAAFISGVEISEQKSGASWGRRIVAGIFAIFAVFYCAVLWPTFALPPVKVIRFVSLGAFWVLLVGLWTAFRNNPRLVGRVAKAFVVIPFAVMFVHYAYLHYTFVQISTHGGGFWQLQRNWEDMQRYVKGHTPKDALIMAPNDMEMGGFRIQSERALLTDYRDCGIVGFDLAATVEWQKRMKDIDAFKVIIKEPFTDALKNGIVKYKVDYIVFMRYAAPKDFPLLTKIYENEVFALYRVNRTN